MIVPLFSPVNLCSGREDSHSHAKQKVYIHRSEATFSFRNPRASRTLQAFWHYQNKAKPSLLIHVQREEQQHFPEHHQTTWRGAHSVLKKASRRPPAAPSPPKAFTLFCYSCLGWSTKTITPMHCPSWESPADLRNKGLQVRVTRHESRNNHFVKSNIFCLKLVFLRFHNIIFSFQEQKQ